MYIALVYRKGSNYQIIDHVFGPFSSHDAASKWMLDRFTDCNGVVIKWMDAPV